MHNFVLNALNDPLVGFGMGVEGRGGEGRGGECTVLKILRIGADAS